MAKAASTGSCLNGAAEEDAGEEEGVVGAEELVEL
jgi:hypothetical protein